MNTGLSAIVGGPERQRLVSRQYLDGRAFWIVSERVGDEWEPTTGGYPKRADAMTEARLQVAEQVAG